MGKHIQAVFDSVEKMNQVRKILKKESDYYPEVLESMSSEKTRGLVDVYLSTLQRYKHEGVWYTRHHLERNQCKEENVEIILNQMYKRFITQLHFSEVRGGYFEMDERDVIQLDEAERLRLRYPNIFSKPNQSNDEGEGEN